MADGEVVVTFQTKMGEALRGVEQLSSSLGKLNAKVDKLNEQSKKGKDDVKKMGEEGASALDKMAQSAAKSLQQIVGITSAAGVAMKVWQAVKADIDAAAAASERAGSHQVSLGGATRSMLRNLGTGSNLSPKGAVSRAMQVAKQTGAGQQSIMSAASGTLSARGNYQASEAFNVVEAVARLDPSLSPQAMTTMAGGAFDLMSAFKTDPKQAIGLLLAGQQSSRVESLEQYGNQVRAIKAGATYGLSPKEAIGGLSAMSVSTGDKTGGISDSGWIKFVEQVMTETEHAGLKGKSFSERLSWLQSDAKGLQVRDKMVGVLGQKLGVDDATAQRVRTRLRRGEKKQHVVGELSGEAVALPTMIGFLTPGSKEAELLRDMMAQTPTVGEAGAFYDQNLRGQEGISLLDVTRKDEQMNALAEKRRLDSKAGMRGIRQRRVDEIMADAKRITPVGWGAVSDFDQWANVKLFGMDPVEAAQGSVRKMIDVESSRGRMQEQSGLFSGTDNFDNAAELRNLLKELQEINQNTKPLPKMNVALPAMPQTSAP